MTFSYAALSRKQTLERLHKQMRTNPYHAAPILVRAGEFTDEDARAMVDKLGYGRAVHFADQLGLPVDYTPADHGEPPHGAEWK